MGSGTQSQSAGLGWVVLGPKQVGRDSMEVPDPIVWGQIWGRPEPGAVGSILLVDLSCASYLACGHKSLNTTILSKHVSA